MEILVEPGGLRALQVLLLLMLLLLLRYGLMEILGRLVDRWNVSTQLQQHRRPWRRWARVNYRRQWRLLTVVFVLVLLLACCRRAGIIVSGRRTYLQRQVRDEGQPGGRGRDARVTKTRMRRREVFGLSLLWTAAWLYHGGGGWHSAACGGLCHWRGQQDWRAEACEKGWFTGGEARERAGLLFQRGRGVFFLSS